MIFILLLAFIIGMGAFSYFLFLALLVRRAWRERKAKQLAQSEERQRARMRAVNLGQ